MIDPLIVELEHGQRRVKQKLVSTLVSPGEWDDATATNATVEPVTGNLILTPRCWEAAFFTSTSSPYDKLALSGFSGLTAASGTTPGWFTHDPTGDGGGVYHTAPSEFGQVPITSTSWPQNTGFHLSWFNYGEGSDAECMRCGWADTPSFLSGVAVRFYLSGKVTVWKNGENVGTYSFPIGAANIQGQRVGVMLCPCRNRELLVVTDSGEGFSHAFADIEPDDTSAVVTPAGKFWVETPSPGTPDFQLARLKFNTSGNASSVPSAFKRAPVAGASPTTYVFHWGGDTPTVGLTVPSGAAFSADGTSTACRVKVTLTGDGVSTAFVKGARAEFAPVTAQTPTQPLDLAEYMLDCTLDVPDDPGGVEARVTLKSPADLEERGMTYLRAIGNRPARLRLGGLTVIEGQTDGGSWEEAYSDETRRYHVRIRDRWKALERSILDDPIPGDKFTIPNALRWLLRYVDLDGSVDIDDTVVGIDHVPGDDWADLWESGDSPAEIIRRLMDTYAATWVYGLKPGTSGTGKPRFYAKAPATLGTAPKLTLYRSTKDALDAGIDPARVRLFVVRSFEEDVLEPEANELYVNGEDPRTGRPITRFVRDLESIDPAVAIADRPRTWQGEVLTVGAYDAALKTAANVRKALEVMEPRLFTERRLSQFSSELLTYRAGDYDVPVWRGDVVRLSGASTGWPDILYRVRSLSASFLMEAGHEGNHPVRPTTYVAEEITA
jgi:hypothetical protein